MGNVKWGKSERGLQVFISSPSDVDRERQEAIKVIDDVNRTLGAKLGFFLRVVNWHKFRPAGENPAKFIEKQLKNCDLFLMIFDRRFGSRPTPDSEYESGTEMEYKIAQELRKQSENQRPEIFAYFKQITDERALEDPGPELSRVLKFKNKVKFTIFYKEYTSTELFPFELKDHLIEWLFEISENIQPRDIRKEGILKSFFDLGTTEESPVPSSLIVYPRSDQKIADETHLLPYMVLEDFQAIHKITKCLNIAGYEHVHSCTLDLYDKAREKHQNEIFLCLPRNKPAQSCLEELHDARFRIEPTKFEDRRTWKIRWKSSSGQIIEVRSPQSAYLLEQRINTEESWRQNPGMCHSVDFAVLARFDDPTSAQISSASGLKKFFIFGIRGLGTWGAAWYLDRRYLELSSKIPNKGPIQLLLRVTYRDYRIRSVDDVSEEAQVFFDKENDPTTIQRRLQRYLE